MICCICGKTFAGTGHDPHPLCAKDDSISRCCDSCSTNVSQANIIAAKDETDAMTNIEINDTIIIFWTKNSNSPIESIKNSNKFISGAVDEIDNSGAETMLYGSWGKYPIHITDSFTKII